MADRPAALIPKDLINGLTEGQMNVVQVMATGVSQAHAARILNVADTYVSKVVRLPHVQAAIREALRGRLEVEIGPLSFETLRSVMSDVQQPGSARVQAARIALQAANWLERNGRDKGEDGKPLQQMSTAELRAELERLEAELGSRAHLVNGSAQLSPPAPSQALDIFD